MKKKMSLVLFAVLLMSAMTAFLGCNAADTPTDEVQETDGMVAPAIMPADHEGRFGFGGMDYCYTCHGASEAGNPTDASAQIIPEDHYVDESYDSQQLDLSRSQCITCHGGS